RIEHTASEPGKYVLEVQDFLYQGGADFYYTLEAQVLETTPSEPATVAVTTDGGGETPPPSPSAEVVRTSLVESLKLSGDRRQRIPFREPVVAAAIGDWATRAGGLDFSLAKE